MLKSFHFLAAGYMQFFHSFFSPMILSQQGSVLKLVFLVLIVLMTLHYLSVFQLLYLFQLYYWRQIDLSGFFIQNSVFAFDLAYFQDQKPLYFCQLAFTIEMLPFDTNLAYLRNFSKQLSFENNFFHQFCALYRKRCLLNVIRKASILLIVSSTVIWIQFLKTLIAWLSTI